MSSTSPSSTPNVEETFARTLERQEKIGDWFYGTLIVGCLLLTIVFVIVSFLH